MSDFAFHGISRLSPRAGQCPSDVIATRQVVSRPGADLLVPKGSSVRSVAELKGKKIAVAEGSSANYHLLAVLKKAGLG